MERVDDTEYDYRQRGLADKLSRAGFEGRPDGDGGPTYETPDGMIKAVDEVRISEVDDFVFPMLQHWSLYVTDALVLVVRNATF